MSTFPKVPGPRSAGGGAPPPHRRRAFVALAAACGLAAAAAPQAPASTIVHQCGAGVCAVDPDTGAAPRTLTADGRTAGVTADGLTASWVEGGALVTRAIAPGGRDATVFTGEIYDLPRISPDGTRALWSWYFAPYGWYTYRTVAGAAGPTPYPPTIDSSTSATTHGWMGASALVIHRGSGAVLARICRADPDGTCTTDIATDPDSRIAWPDGRDDGSAVVAVRGPDDGGFGVPSTGRIAVYAGGTRSHDVTEGPADTLPSWSAEGDRIAFQRDGGIWVVDAAGGTPRRVADGGNPAWGGARTVAPGPGTPGPGTPAPGGPAPGTPGPGTPAPGPPGTGTTPGGPSAAVLRVASSSLRYRRGTIAVRVRCGAATTCRGTLRIARGTTTIGSRSYRIARNRTADVVVTPGRAARRTLAKARRHRVSVRLSPRSGPRVSRTVTLRR